MDGGMLEGGQAISAVAVVVYRPGRLRPAARTAGIMAYRGLPLWQPVPGMIPPACGLDLVHIDHFRGVPQILPLGIRHIFFPIR